MSITYDVCDETQPLSKLCADETISTIRMGSLSLEDLLLYYLPSENYRCPSFRRINASSAEFILLHLYMQADIAFVVSASPTYR
jgi:hypothetical protein